MFKLMKIGINAMKISPEIKAIGYQWSTFSDVSALQLISDSGGMGQDYLFGSPLIINS